MESWDPAGESHLTTDPRESGVATARRRLPWHVIYYLLAAFDVLTVSGSLYLSRRLFEVHVHAVADNQEWAAHVDEYSGLEQLAAEVNAPGNDVFASHDVARESARLRTAQVAFRQRLIGVREHLNAAHPDEAPALSARLDEVEQVLHEMASEAEVTFAELAAGQPERAARRMAAMDRRYARVLHTLRELRSDAARVQRHLFAEQTATGSRLRRFGLLIAGLVFLMVGAAIVYGRQIDREMRREALERARYLGELHKADEALRGAHAQLEQRVEERTRALSESEAALRLAASDWRRTFDAIDSPLMILDLEGRLIRSNLAARTLAGRNAEDHGAPHVGSLGPGEPWRSIAQLVDHAHESGVAGAAHVKDEESGRSWELTSYLAPPAGSQKERLIVAARDTTRLEQLQEALGREETMAAMGALVAGVAHEVRNPIFAISSTLDAFEARFGGERGFDRYFDVLRREVERLRHLMKDLLEYGSPPRLEKVPTRLRHVVAEGLRACDVDAERAQVTLANDIDASLPEVHADPLRLAQVVQNLVHNAVIHSPPEGQVIVTGRPAPVDGLDGVECTVRDHGPGFRQEDLARVFEPLVTGRAGGTGLGLAIAQRIVEQHGGSVRAANAADGGAVVSFRIPFGAPPLEDPHG